MPKLRAYVAEVTTLTRLPEHETWTLMAPSLNAARRAFKKATSSTIVAVAPVRPIPTRHWRAGT